MELAIIKDQILVGAGVAMPDMHVIHPDSEDFPVVQVVHLVEVPVVPERPQDLVELVEDKIS